MKKNLCLLPVLPVLAIALALLSSCEDDKLAKSMNGTWTGSIMISNDDQSKEKQDIYLKFNYIPSNDTSGGTYIEVRRAVVNGVDLDDAKMDVGYCSYIEGTWEVIAGALVTKPNVSTLKVNIDPQDVKIDYDNAWAALDGLYDEFSSLGYSRKEMASDLQKDLYTDLFHQYKEDENNDGEVTWYDLKVNGETMSFATDDIGTFTLHKTNEDIIKVFNIK